MHRYRAALVGCGRMGAFIDNEVASSPTALLPYSHAAGYEACDRTDLIAGSDMRGEVLEKFGERYGVAPEHHYTDFKAMIVTEHPDILSIATQPQDRAEVILFAIENGVKALYPEKPLCASMAEAQAIRTAVQENGVALNMGANRRFSPAFAAMREKINSGDLGKLTTIDIHLRSTIFNTHSHWVDLLRYLNNDAPVAWVQANLLDDDGLFDGDIVTGDPYCEATIAFENGVIAHLIATEGAISHRAYCQRGEIIACAGDSRLEVWSYGPMDEDGADRSLSLIEFTPRSGTSGLIDDLVHALDTGEPTQGGIDAAYANIEILFAMLESHRRDGVRIALPLLDSTLVFAPNIAPRQPRYEVKPA